MASYLLSLSVRTKKRIDSQARIQYGTPDVSVLFSEAKLEIYGGDQFIYTRKIKIRALSDGVNGFKLLFGYSGDLKDCRISEEHGARVRFGSLAGNNQHWCLASFKSMMRGDELEYSYSIEIDDSSSKRMCNFLAFSCTFPIEKYVFHEIYFLDEKSAPRIGRIREFETVYALNGTEMDMHIENGGICKRIAFPKIGRRYTIEW